MKPPTNQAARGGSQDGLMYRVALFGFLIATMLTSATNALILAHVFGDELRGTAVGDTALMTFDIATFAVWTTAFVCLGLYLWGIARRYRAVPDGGAADE